MGCGVWGKGSEADSRDGPAAMGEAVVHSPESLGQL